MPFNELSPSLSSGIRFLDVRKAWVCVRVFVAQVGQHVTGFVGQNIGLMQRRLDADGRRRYDGRLVESIRTAARKIVYEQNRQVTSRHERFEQSVHFPL